MGGRADAGPGGLRLASVRLFRRHGCERIGQRRNRHALLGQLGEGHAVLGNQRLIGGDDRLAGLQSFHSIFYVLLKTKYF